MRAKHYFEDAKNKFCFTLVFTIIFVTAVSAYASIEGTLPPGTEEVLEEIQETMYPPWAHNVILDPETPIAYQPTIVTAHVYNDASKTRDETYGVFLMYSADIGDTWDRVEMEPLVEGRIWTASLPGFPPGTEVLYGFSAEDSSGNVYTETPCLVTEWPPGDDPCMFDLAIDEPPVDDEDVIIPEDFDLISFRGGVDEDYLYIEMTVEGTIADGTLNPMFVHLYGLAVANPDKGDASDITTQGFIALWAPSAEAFSYDACSIIHQPANDIVIESRNIECETDGESTLWFKISNDQIGKTPSKHLKIIAVDGALTNISPFEGVFYDYTHVSSIALVDRWFIVE